MLSETLAGERHHTFTESHMRAIEAFIDDILAPSVCECSKNGININNIKYIIFFIFVINFAKVGIKNQTKHTKNNKVSTMGYSFFYLIFFQNGWRLQKKYYLWSLN